MSSDEPELWDVIIIGAGPAGLSAALYLARFRRRVLVVHDGTARALRIPKTHNVPGYPEGVSGRALIRDMTMHADTYGAHFLEQRVLSIERETTFEVLTDGGEKLRSRALILATGLHLNQIPLPPDVHEAAIWAGVLRYCPVCDAYEHSGKRIGVVGCDRNGAAEALFLRQYSDAITLLTAGTAELSTDDRQQLAAADIKVLTAPVERYAPTHSTMDVILSDAERISFDVVYPALGTSPRNRLSSSLGLSLDDDGKVAAASVFGTPIVGLWCAGDIVEGLDQVSVAMGHGAIAATKAHNWLREQDGHTVETLEDFEEVDAAPVEE